MIENSEISLRPENLPRQDAKGILRYTLLLNYAVTQYMPNAGNYISQVMEATDRCCSPLITSDQAMVEYDFFGSNSTYSQNNLLYLNQYPVPKEFSNLPQNTSFSKLLVQNSLMAAYHALLTEYLAECATTSYQIVNTLKGTGVHKIMNTPKNGKPCLIIENDKTKLLNLPNYNENKQLSSSKAATFEKKYTKRLENFPTLFDFTGIKHTESSYNYYLQYVALTKRIVDAKDKNLKYFFYYDKENDKRKDQKPEFSQQMIETLLQLIEDFIPAFSAKNSKTISTFLNQSTDIVDEVYEHYLAEKSFSLNLFHHTLNLIQDTEEKQQNRYNLKNKDTLEIIAKCKKLPCPFIRPYLLQFAFDHIDDETTSYLDYWNRHDLNTRDTVASRTKKPGGFHYGQWLHQFELFVDYLSAYIIPVYDWCFLSMLLDGIEKENTSASHLEILELAIKEIGNYIQKNAQEILFPLKANPYKKNFYPIGDSIEWVAMLKNEFYNEHSVNLNIPPLTRELFTYRKNANGLFTSSLQSLHDFYIESIINPY